MTGSFPEDIRQGILTLLAKPPKKNEKVMWDPSFTMIIKEDSNHHYQQSLLGKSKRTHSPVTGNILEWKINNWPGFRN